MTTPAYLVTRTNAQGTVFTSQQYDSIANALEYYSAVINHQLAYAFTATLYVEGCAISQTTVA